LAANREADLAARELRTGFVVVRTSLFDLYKIGIGPSSSHTVGLCGWIIRIPHVEPNSPFGDRFPGRGVAELYEGVMNIQDMRLGRSVGIREEERLWEERIDQMAEALRKSSHGRRVAQRNNDVRAEDLDDTLCLILPIDDGDWVEAPTPHGVVQAHGPDGRPRNLRR
jgi:Serine dehydratase beta chain